VVEIWGKSNLVASCKAVVEEGMQVLRLDGEPIKAGDAAYFAENDSD
jgi:NADH dehydrogenase/NADH:ubiquinone oxidoreductase subunit G